MSKPVRTFTPEQRAQRAAVSRAWYQKNRDAFLERLRNRTEEERAELNRKKRARYAADPAFREQTKASSAAWRANPENRVALYAAQRAYDNSPKGQATRRAIRLRTYFQMTPEQYDSLFVAQDGVCAICRRPETKQHRGRGPVQELSVDHDHRCCPGKTSCGECVRGLLCDRCNLCRFPDDPVILRAAADYFERYAVPHNG